jgi:hypothetical protein
MPRVRLAPIPALLMAVSVALAGPAALLLGAPASASASGRDPLQTLPRAPTAPSVVTPRSGPCPPGQVAYREGGSGVVKCIPGPPCGPEQTRDAQGRCRCPAGQVAYREGGSGVVKCIPGPPCGPEQTRDASGQCRCPAGQVAYREGTTGTVRCVPAR